MQNTLNTLDDNLHLRTVNLANTSLKESLAQFKKSDSNQIGLLIQVSDSNNPVIKIYSLLSICIRILFLKSYLSYKNLKLETVYGVYPSVTDPVAIYQLNTVAAKYMHKNVLPAFPSGVNGSLRKFILKLTKLHPSLAGAVLLIEKFEKP